MRLAGYFFELWNNPQNRDLLKSGKDIYVSLKVARIWTVFVPDRGNIISFLGQAFVQTDSFWPVSHLAKRFQGCLPAIAFKIWP